MRQKPFRILIKRSMLLVGYGLTSYSAIFQLYGDGTVVQFSKFRPTTGHPTPWASRGLLCAKPTLTRPWDVSTHFNLLAIRQPTDGESMPGIEPRSPGPQSSLLLLPQCNGPTAQCKFLSALQMCAQLLRPRLMHFKQVLQVFA